MLRSQIFYQRDMHSICFVLPVSTEYASLEMLHSSWLSKV